MIETTIVFFVAGPVKLSTGRVRELKHSRVNPQRRVLLQELN